MNSGVRQIESFDKRRVLAAKYFAIGTTIVVAAVIVRSLIQQSYPTTAILVIALCSGWWLIINVEDWGYSKTTLLEIIILICVSVQGLLFFKLGFISGGPFLMIMVFSLISLLPGRKRRYIFCLLNMLPLIGLTASIFLGFAAPRPENISEYITAKSTWLSLTITAVTFGTVAFLNTDLLANFLSDQGARYRSAVFDTMTKLSLLRDNETGEHIQRCSQYALSLLTHCSKHNYDTSIKIDPLTFEQAVKLHDIGKIAVGDYILKKPGKLNQDELKEMQKHTLYGVEIIEEVAKTNSLKNDPVVIMGIEIAKHHHENWDGSGYPHGRAYKMFADNIALESRIMSIIDVYDALRSPRVYKEPCSHQDTLRIMTEMSGKKFDPHLFKLFLQISDEFDAIYNQGKDQTN